MQTPAEAAARELLRRRTEPVIVVRRADAETGEDIYETHLFWNRGRRRVWAAVESRDARPRSTSREVNG